MYIGLKNIQHLFSNFPNLLTNSDGIHCLTGWTKLASAVQPYTNHLLYTCSYTRNFNPAEFPFTEETHLLCIVKPGTDLTEISGKFPDSLSLLVLEAACPENIYTELQNYFNMQCGVGMFGQTLLEYLSFDSGLQPAVEHSFGALQNPVFVFDTNYNLIAATWNAIEKLNIRDQVIRDRHFTDEDFKMASRMNNIHSKVRKSEIPVRAYNETLGYEQMYCAINTKKDLGHIVVSAVNKPFEPIDVEFLLTLKKYVNQQMEKDSFIRNSRGFNYEYFLKDLLDKKIAADRSSMTQMKYVESEFSGNMYCMVVETARSLSTISSTHIRNTLESHFPYSKTLVYNGQVIAILSIRDNHLIPKEYLSMGRKICVENGLYAGLSNCFRDIMTFTEYYNQALRAIELGSSEHNAPGLFCYEDYYLDHVKNIFTQKESPETFCHPKMKFLLDYDHLHHSELAYTLYMYLTHERNLAATAEAMDMHRSSLVYRFKKINSLLGDDFEDYKDRMYLILSYEMNEKK